MAEEAPEEWQLEADWYVHPNSSPENPNVNAESALLEEQDMDSLLL